MWRRVLVCLFPITLLGFEVRGLWFVLLKRLRKLVVWSDCVVGYLLEKKVPFPVVKTIVMKIWQKFGIYEVLANDRGFFFFRFAQDDAHRKIIESGPCHIAGKLLILKKWKPQMVLQKEQLSSIPIFTLKILEC